MLNSCFAYTVIVKHSGKKSFNYFAPNVFRSNHFERKFPKKINQKLRFNCALPKAKIHLITDLLLNSSLLAVGSDCAINSIKKLLFHQRKVC